jgi:serine/threonine protein kinase
MHNVGIAHRDLQPSNVLFDEHGFIRVCDFNSSVVMSLQKDGRAYSTVGCPFYMSPEVIKTRGHGFAADWWSLGCIVFEMLTGYPPFYDVNRLGCYQKVLVVPACRFSRLMRFSPLIIHQILLGHVDCPPSLHPIAKDFVLGCLRVDERERFHTGKTDVFGGNCMRAHPWFQDLDWDTVETKLFVPEWRPIETLSGKMDLRCSAAKCFASLASFLMISPDTRLI